MDNYCIYHFTNSSGSKEFVVISAERIDLIEKEYEENDILLDSHCEIDGDAITFPCDRPLRTGF